MIELHVPWLELTILIPLLGAAVIGRVKVAEAAWRGSGIIAAASLACALGAWWDFGTLHTFEAHDRWSLFACLLYTSPSPRD